MPEIVSMTETRSLHWRYW